MSMIMVDSGHIAVAKAAKDREFYLAWGTLPPDYANPWGPNDIPPAVNPTDTDLILEVGRRIYTIKEYVIEDPNGNIEANGKFWSISTVPTRNLYLQFRFRPEEASDQVIYQIGLFMDSVPVAGLPTTQEYFTPDQIADKGTLVLLENVKPIARNANTKEIFDIVITF